MFLPRWVRFISSVCGLGVGLALTCAQLGLAAPYAAHPHRSFEEVESEQASLLVAESLYALAMHYDGLTLDARSSFRYQLLASPAIAFLLNVPRARSPRDAQESEVTLEGALRSGLRSVPSLASQPGSLLQSTLSADKKMELAHELYRLVARIQNVSLPQRPDTIVDASFALSAHSPLLITSDCGSASEKLSMIRLFCDQLHNIPAHDWVNHWIQDIWEIVTPYESPLRAGPRSVGQIEALTRHLVRVTLTGRPTLIRTLRRLQKVDQLDSSLEEWQALEKAIAQVSSVRLLPVELLRLEGLASHNHGVEFFLRKVMLHQIDRPERAVREAKETATALNHLYFLLENHRLARGVPARFYHYWGGAIVSCELVLRGHTELLARAASHALGAIYEQLTAVEKRGGEALPDLDDIALHAAGADFGASICVP